MPAWIIRFSAIVAAVTTVAEFPAEAQQQVIVTVAAVPNPVAPGSCARIVADVRDERNRQLMPENGAPLQWSYTSANAVDFEWRQLGASGESALCAKPGSAAVTTQVIATITGMDYSGATVVAVAPGAPGGAPATSPAGVPTQPYVPPAQPYPASAATTPSASDPSAHPATVYSPPGPTTAPEPPTATYSSPQAAPVQPAAAPAQSPAAVAPQPQAPAAPPPPQVAAQPVKTGGGFFKKLGSHIKQRATQVKTETGQTLNAAAAQIVDTAFQTGTRLVASTTAEVTNTARMGIGGVGRRLMLVPQRGGGSADNLTIAIASGRAVLPEIRFTPGTSVLEPSGRELVNRLGTELRNEMARAPAIQFEIYAHVDSGPSPQVLSEERAAAVKAVLSNYTDARRLTALGFGASQPMPGAPGSRIEIVRCNDGQTKCWR